MADEAATSVDVKGVHKSFGKREALAGIGFRGEGASIVGMVGPNGSGKSTLIRIMLGLLRPDRGTVTINGKGPRRLIGRKGFHVGYMPQGDALYEDLTARQNIEYFARIQGVRRGAVKDRTDEALSFVELEDRARDKVTELSGGMRRRVSLACAIVHSPRLLMLDEPTVGLDPELRVKMWDGFRQLRKRGCLVFVSTHYMAEADRCDEVLLMREGRLLALEPPETLMARTKTRSLEDAFLAIIKEGPTK